MAEFGLFDGVSDSTAHEILREAFGKWTGSRAKNAYPAAVCIGDMVMASGLISKSQAIDPEAIGNSGLASEQSVVSDDAHKTVRARMRAAPIIELGEDRD